MKHRLLLVVLVVFALVAVAMVARAQQGEPEMPMMTDEEMDDAMAGPMGGMMGRAALAVAGDNIYVVAGGLLLKYDTDLQLVAQTELPMSEMTRGWMHRRGMGRRGGGGGGGRGMGMGPGGGGGGRGMGPGGGATW